MPLYQVGIVRSQRTFIVVKASRPSAAVGIARRQLRKEKSHWYPDPGTWPTVVRQPRKKPCRCKRLGRTHPSDLCK